MTVDSNNTFTLRFFENEVTPESFSAKELGQLIISFYEGLKELIDVRFPSVNSEEVQLSLVGIENKSESLIFKSSGQAEVMEALEDLGASVTSNTYTDLPIKTYRAVQQIYGFSKRKKCIAELVQKGKRLFVVTPQDQLIKQGNVLIKSEMVLYGELNKIGGDKTKAWVELYDGSKITFPINDEQLIKLRSKVKEPVAIRGKATWNVLSKRVVSFKLIDVIDYNAGRVASGFEEIRSISRGWDDINNNQDLKNFLKGEA